MDMSGEQRIDAPREVVWDALNDVEILRKCIPGCQELDKQSETEMTALAVIKVGPVSAKFQGAVTLSDLDPPNGYRITGEGQGGVAGFAKGSAEVRLTSDGGATILHYTVAAQIGGKLSQLGGRLIDATARKMSDAFFKRFAEEIAAAQAGAGAAAAPAQAAASASSQPASAAATAAPSAQAGGAPATARPQFRRSFDMPPPAAPTASGWATWLNTMVLAAAVLTLGWAMIGGGVPRLATPQGSPLGLSPDLAAAVQLLLILAVGYVAGRQHGAGRESAVDRQLLLALLMQRRGPDA